MELKLSVEGGTWWYRPERILFSAVDFSVGQGEIAAILGPNGVGKTTFLKCLMGLLQWRQGKTVINGVELSQIGRKELWQTIAYVPQARTLPFSFTVTDVVLMGRTSRLSAFAQPGAKDRRAAEKALERMGISRLGSRKFAELSGGEAQLVFIARALATEPKLVILDEPESHLDFRNQLVILNALQDLARKDGIACVINTHFPEHALRIADRCLLLGKGSTGHRFGDPSSLTDERNMKAFFGVRVRNVSFEDNGATYRGVYPMEPVW
jgi:iron complex transport system ATP-binding protein